jgi:predicted transcriptional regulator
MKKNSSPEFSRVLKAALAERGLRETDVAKALGISTASVSRIIRARRRARAEERRKLEELLGYQVARLLRRRGRRVRSWPSRTRR